MAYIKNDWNKFTWKKGQVNFEDQLNHMEQGIEEASGKAYYPGQGIDITNSTISIKQEVFDDIDTKATIQYVDEKIAAIKLTEFKVVETLPEVGQSNIIYLIKHTPEQEKNIYDEYIWLNDQQKYELIGTTKIDISGKADKIYVDEQLALKASVNALNDEADARQTADNQEAVTRQEADTNLQNNINLKQDILIAGDNIQINGVTISATDTIYDDTQIKADIALKANSADVTAALATKQDVISDLTDIREGAALGKTAIQQHQDISGKLNILPNVDDPEDPGYGNPYWIPYNFGISTTSDKLDITLHTLTLDNKLLKHDFTNSFPVASTINAGVMTGSDKTKLDAALTEHQSLAEYRKSADQDIIDATKQDKLTAGENIQLNNNVISATDTKYTVTIDI